METTRVVNIRPKPATSTSGARDAGMTVSSVTRIASLARRTGARSSMYTAYFLERVQRDETFRERVLALKGRLRSFCELRALVTGT